MVRTEFKEIVKQIKETKIPYKITIRRLLWLFDYSQKRTSGNVWRLNEYLQKEKLITEPNYQYGWIDDEIELKEPPKATIKKEDISIDTFDPISQVSNLKAANKLPISIKKEESIEKAYHLMWENDFSQIPVMNDERNVLGIITWQTIAKGLIKKESSKIAKDFMSNSFSIIEHNTPIFDAIKEVVKKGVVFIRDKDKIIKGPITTSDLNEEFLEQIEPFILLEQIENYIRLILHNKISLEDLQKTLDNSNVQKIDYRKIECISDMTFGEYKAIIEKEEFWKLLNLPLDKSLFVNSIDNIRKIRNSVMHFHLDNNSAEDEEQLKQLRKIAKFLQDFYRIK